MQQAAAQQPRQGLLTMTCQVRGFYLDAVVIFVHGCPIASQFGLCEGLCTAESCHLFAGPGRSGNAFDEEPDISSDDDRRNNASDVELSD